MNKKLLGIVIATLITCANTVPAFAAEKTAKVSVNKETKIEAKKEKQAEKVEKQTQKTTKLQEKATKLGINIEGLTNKEAESKLEEVIQAKFIAKSEKLGIDITGLSKNEIKAKINEAKAEKQSLKAEKNTSKTIKE